MLIRTVDIADYDALTEFWQKIPGVRLVDADSRPAIDRYLSRNPGMSFLAEDEGKIVGSVFTGHDGRRGYLFHYAVAPEYRDLSMARELLKRSFEALQAEGISRCFGFILSGNDRAHKLAELTGWERVTEFDVYSQWLVRKDAV